MKSFGIPRRTAVTLACASAALAAPAGAVALATHPAAATDPPPPALTTHSKTTSTLTSGQLMATATCGADEQVVSGGYKTSNQSGTGGASVSLTSDGKSWTVDFYPFTTDTLTTYAYCARDVSVSAHLKHVAAAAGRHNTTGTARCAAGQTLVAGGHQFGPATGESNSPTYTDYAAGGKWTVMSVFLSTPGKLYTYAYCERHVVVKVRSSTSGSIHDGADGSATASCHTGETLLSGGYTTTPTPDWHNEHGPDLFYSASYRSGMRSWTASAHNFGEVSGKITAFAYCEA